MKLLTFPIQVYSQDPRTLKLKFNSTESSKISLLEILWSAVNNAQLRIERKEFKVIRRVKDKIREVTMFKDDGMDSRIPYPKENQLLLETDEFDMLKKLLDHNQFSPVFAEEIDSLWTLIEEAPDYVPPKPQSVKTE